MNVKQSSHSGNFSASVEPSYILDMSGDGSMFVEPYAILGFDYEFAREQVEVGIGQEPHQNDQSAFTVGAGVNL